MTLRNFEIFVKTCETCNMTTAAQQLYISQSAVSHAISQLEDYFNLTLFIRQANHIYLTAAGSLLLAHSKRLLETHSRLETAMQLERTHHHIRIGIVNTFGQHLILELVADFLNEHPNMDISIHSYPENVIPEMLNVSAIDVAFTFDNKSTKYTSSLLIRKREKGFCCMSRSRYLNIASDGTVISISDLPKGKLPFFFESDSVQFIDTIWHSLRKHGIDIEVRGILHTPDEVKHAVSLDLGIGMVSKSGCFANERIRYFDIEQIKYSVDLYLVYNLSQAENPYISELINFIDSNISERKNPKLQMYAVYTSDDINRPKHAFYD